MNATSKPTLDALPLPTANIPVKAIQEAVKIQSQERSYNSGSSWNSPEYKAKNKLRNAIYEWEEGVASPTVNQLHDVHSIFA